MSSRATTPFRSFLSLLLATAFSLLTLEAEIRGETTATGSTAEPPSLEMLKASGMQRSRFKDVSAADTGQPNSRQTESVGANLRAFESTVKPLLQQHCIDCHGPDTTEGNLRIDTLNPDLVTGEDTDWWSEVFAVITKGEMPPPGDGDLVDEERQQLVDWLSAELHTASIVRRRTGERSSFRRMTRYEYNYALQDLLGLPWDFAVDLPPEAHTEEGFQNSSELLHLSVSQFETYHRIARKSLRRAAITGDQPPTLHWSIPMRDAAQREWDAQDKQLSKLEKDLKEDPEKLAAELEKLRTSFTAPRNAAYYHDRSNGRIAKADWNYRGARYAFAPTEQVVGEAGVVGKADAVGKAGITEVPEADNCVAILPNGRGPRLIIELGNRLPDEGTMRVTVRASRVNTRDNVVPNLQLLFGWQASNEGRALLSVSDDTPVTANSDQPQVIQWDVPLGEIYPRNSVRKTSPMGSTPSPSEYIRLINSSVSASEIQIDYVHVAAPVYDQWPPQSHSNLFIESDHEADESTYAREIITHFMRRAWRRPVTDDEIDAKSALFDTLRPHCDTFEEAVVETLATVLSSPQFLYITAPSTAVKPEAVTADTESEQEPRLNLHPLADRLSMFLWCSIPDPELLALADSGELAVPEVLGTQIQRMLDDPRSERFARHFVHQWLNLELLEFQNFKQNVRGFDPLLKEAMLHEPVGLFSEILGQNASVLDFIHCNYTVINERLARHYGWPNVKGNQFRRVKIGDDFRRGGLLTQAGVLAMNSDWPDSHPLKRAIWLLESILADPPPPPPPAVPQIDLADPEIAKMTLKERIEDHRNHAACMSCHVKIDPWGIAFENYDALGRWRSEIQGKPVDASSELFNRQTLDGMNGLKRYLLNHRQDQFVRAMVSKLTAYALGRTLTFADQADLDAITAQVRQEGDGLRTIVQTICQSDLFRSR